jgi:hypothetical protein
MERAASAIRLLALPLALGMQFGGFTARNVERIEFLQLEGQQIEPRCPVRLGLPQLVQPFGERLPFDVVGGNHRAVVEQPPEVIQQVPLHVPPAQRLVKMLAVNVEQQFAESLQLGKRDGIAVDEAPGAPVGTNDPAQQALIVEVERLFFEPRPYGRQGREIETGGKFGAPGAFAYQLGTAAVPEDQAESVDQDRFAGAGLTGEHRHPGLELDVDTINDRKIAHLQVDQHFSAPARRCRVCGCRVPRTAWNAKCRRNRGPADAAG